MHLLQSFIHSLMEIICNDIKDYFAYAFIFLSLRNAYFNYVTQSDVGLVFKCLKRFDL